MASGLKWPALREVDVSGTLHGFCNVQALAHSAWVPRIVRATCHNDCTFCVLRQLLPTDVHLASG